MQAELPVLCEPRLDMAAPDVSDAVAAASLLADRTRASIVALLADGPVCVCEISAALGQADNTVSNHLAKLRDAGVVRAVRHEANARYLYYSLDQDRVAALRTALLGVLR